VKEKWVLTVRGRGERRETQPVGGPPDWADDAAEPAGHGPAPATSPGAFSGDVFRHPCLRKPIFFPWVS
jgi:hypothetical protein